MRAAAALALACLTPPVGASTCNDDAPVAGFAPGQAMLAAKPVVGRTVELSLVPVETVRFATPWAARPAVGSFGGAFALDVANAGAYRVALSAPAALILAREGGASVEPDAHAPDAPCGGVARLVTLRLDAGRYTLQLAGAPQRAIVVRIVRAAEMSATQ